jgi:mono/diheme cytochrome c family protein
VSYLKSAPAKETFTDKQAAALPGATEYLNHCGFCHQPDGRGIEGAVPSLAGDGTVLAGGPQDVVRTILGGRPATGSYGIMPGMATTLDSAQIAGIANYVRTAWGNGAPATATTAMVDDLAKQTSTMLSGTGGCDAAPPAVTKAVAGSGAEAALHQVNQDNMVEQVDAILGKVTPAGHAVAQADIVNGLTAAYCPIVMADTTKQPRERLLLLQRFATLVYTRLHQSPAGGQPNRVSTNGGTAR